MARHLALVVVIKLLVLALLWWFFVRDLRVLPDAASVATHIGGNGSLANPALPPKLQGVRP